MIQGGHLHLICGMAGSGKTTLARRLEEELGAVRLSPDEWIIPLLEAPDDRQEMTRIRPTIDALQWGLVQRLLSLGNTVIWEQGFWHKAERERYREEARALGALVSLHYLDVPVTDLKARIARRNEELPEGSFQVGPDEIDEWMTWFKPPMPEELELYDHAESYTAELSRLRHS